MVQQCLKIKQIIFKKKTTQNQQTPNPMSHKLTIQISPSSKKLLNLVILNSINV